MTKITMMITGTTIIMTQRIQGRTFKPLPVLDQLKKIICQKF